MFYVSQCYEQFVEKRVQSEASTAPNNVNISTVHFFKTNIP